MTGLQIAKILHIDNEYMYGYLQGMADLELIKRDKKNSRLSVYMVKK